MTSEQHPAPGTTDTTSSSPNLGGSRRRRGVAVHPARTARNVSIGAAAVLVVGTVGVLTLTEASDARGSDDGVAVRGRAASPDTAAQQPDDGWSNQLPSDEGSDGAWVGGGRRGDRGSSWQPGQPDGSWSGDAGGSGGFDGSGGLGSSSGLGSSGGFGGSRSGAS